MARIILGVSGASGIVLAYRALSVLTELNHSVELIMTKDACYTAMEELGSEFSTPDKFVLSLSIEQQRLVNCHKVHDMGASIASGTYPVDGMLILPCSMATLAAISMGLSDNLVRRAADVTIKERRKLVVVPRESPLSEIHLENMLRLSRLGCMIVPPVPGWYTKPKTLEDVENFIVGRALNALGIESKILPRWKL